MAKGLQVGDIVSVRKLISISKDTEAYKNGLQEVSAGREGKVVAEGKGRTVIVDFEGMQAQVSNQSLELSKRPKKRGRPKGSVSRGIKGRKIAKPVGRPPKSANSGTSDMVNYDSPQFAAKVANKLLMSGGAEPNPETVVVEIKLSQLPDSVQNEIKRLLKQKLSLGLEDTQNNQGNAPRKRGRPKGSVKKK